VIDILEGDDILVHLINTYNPPTSLSPHLYDTTLKYLTDHDLDNSHLTVLIGDFNTHTNQWSIPEMTPSSWAEHLCDWIDNHSSFLNPLLTPTRQGSRPNERDSVLDLAFANEAVC